jgi:hypothetical protein
MPAICFASGWPAHLVDLSTRHYPGLRGEGWIPVPLPPPARATLCFLRMNSRAIKPSNGGDISYELRTPVPQSGPLFSERPVSLRSYGLHPFGTVLEIRTLGATYEFQRKEVLSIFSDRREPLISKLAISL